MHPLIPNIQYLTLITYKSVKLILPIEATADIQGHLPHDMEFVRVDSDGNLDGDASDAEVYLNWFYLRSDVLHKVLAEAPALRWQHTLSAGVNHI